MEADEAEQVAEVNAAAEAIYDMSDPDANIIFGSSVDESYGDEMAVTVVATSFERFEEQVLSQTSRAPPAPLAPRQEAPACLEPPRPSKYGEPQRPRKFWRRF